MLVSRTRFQKGRFGNTQSTKMHDEKRYWRNFIMHTLTGGKTHGCKACRSKCLGQIQRKPRIGTTAHTKRKPFNLSSIKKREFPKALRSFMDKRCLSLPKIHCQTAANQSGLPRLLAEIRRRGEELPANA
jgi:hypothetical protein